MDKKPFIHKLTAQPEDIDQLGHVNNVVYVRWVQEVAAAHWDTVASPDLLLKYSWVVLRHEIDYKNPAFNGDEIIGSTWVGNHQGPRSERYVILTAGKTGKVLAEAKTIWCMIDSKTFRPIRITEEVTSVL